MSAKAKTVQAAPAELALRGRALTDMGNGERLAAEHGADLRYCFPWQRWIVWDGRRWASDDTGEAERRAKTSVLALLAEAAATDDDRERKRLVQHVARSESATARRALLDSARSEPGIPVLPDALDRDPFLLNVGNGTIELRSGDLRPHNRGDLLTKLADVAYDPAATCPRWDAFLDRVTDGRADLGAFLQRAIGYALTGSTGEQVLFLLHGTGANGKTVFVETSRAMLGDYGLSTPAETLLERRDTIPNDIARLRGARFVAAVETGDGHRLAEGRIKQLTGGDMIAARFMRAEWFEFQPTHKLFLATNHKPSIRGTDEAIWRRIRLIPFDVTIPEGERDPELTERLRAELPGILAWAVRGCLAWQAEGLGAPEAVTAATSAYRATMDVLGDWIADRCVVLDSIRAKAGDLYVSYREWCEQNGERGLSQRAFATCLTERGYAQTRTNAARWWEGISLLHGDGTLLAHPEEDEEAEKVTRDASVTLPPITPECARGHGTNQNKRHHPSRVTPETPAENLLTEQEQATA